MSMSMDSMYSPPTALTVLSGIFLILGAISFLIITCDIILRKGWRSMMWIMIPAYPINAAYLGPLSLLVYFKYGRPAKPDSTKATPETHCHSKKDKDLESRSSISTAEPPLAAAKKSCCHGSGEEKQKTKEDDVGSPSHCHNQKSTTSSSEPSLEKSTGCHSKNTPEQSSTGTPEATVPHCHSHSNANSRPMLATVLVGVHHCGAGCVLGDLVGEWLVYGTNATINGQGIWVELLVDYAFALLFGILFQYFSIAPMTGEYGPKSVWRAAKADILSLTSFEIGAFGWMIIYQVGIWDYRLEMTTWTYWWMMQVGMACGFATAIPVNYFLLTKGIKEPCC